MAEFAPQPLQMGIGNDILDIGSRKARRRGADPMMMGTPGQFDVPNVSNVSSLSYHIISYHIISLFKRIYIVLFLIIQLQLLCWF
ncbi:MAG: hypothetical protein ACI90V_005973 [Bacillariaceae sp.]|jgi:hypothetical protein